MNEEHTVIPLKTLYIPMHRYKLSENHMFLLRNSFAVVTLAFAFTQSALAQDRAFSFSLTGGAAVQPDYFGSDSYGVGPSGAFGFTGLRFGSAQFGDPDGPTHFAPGSGLRGAFRYIPRRAGTDELLGLDNVRASVEVGLGLHYTTDTWQIYSDLRYGAIGHRGMAAELGANLIYRGENGLVLHAGPRAEWGNSRFMRSYFGISPTEAAQITALGNAGLGALTPAGGFRPSSGIYSVGVELGAYQPISDNWGVTGSLRFDRLRGDAAASPIVQQGRRDQITAEIGLTRHFNLRF